MDITDLLQQYNLPAEVAELLLEQASQINLQESQINLQESQISALATQLDCQKSTIEKMAIDNAALKQLLANLNRLKYGRQSEKYNNPQQGNLFADDLAADIAHVESTIEALEGKPSTQDTDDAKTKQPPVKRVRKPFPAALPRVEHVHDLVNKDCLCCGNALAKIRDEVTEKIEIIPAQIIVHKHIYPQYSCKSCQTVSAERVAPSLIPNSMAEVSAWAYVIISKYLDHLPLYRISQMLERSGIELNRSTMAGWVGTAGFHLQPLVDALLRMLLSHNSIHGDETPVQQLMPGSGKTQRAYLWVYRSNDLAHPDERIVVFDYHDNRKSACVEGVLRKWKGHLMVDDYAGYKGLFASGDIIELGCMAHARRKFYALYAANQSATAAEAITMIGELYAIEAHCKTMSTEDRLAYRQLHSAPKLLAFKQWLEEKGLQTAASSGIGKAVRYSLRRIYALSCYAQTGHLPIDNNPVENCIRPIAIGKKNWLFAGSKSAGQRAANLQTLLGTAKLNGINPHQWLTYVLTVLPTLKSNDNIEHLLPLAGFKIPE